MRYVERFVNHKKQSFLEISINDSDDVEELYKYAEESNIMVGMDNLECLLVFRSVKKLIITSGPIRCNPNLILEKLYNLEVLIIEYYESESGTEYTLDISALPRVEYLFSRSSLNFTNISDCKTLKSLSVFDWHDQDLSSLSRSNLDTLFICNGKLSSLNGIQELPLLILSLNYLRNLKCMDALIDSHIKILDIQHCNKVEGIQSSIPHSLEYLMCSGNNVFHDLSFLKQSSIKRILLDFDVEDGNLEILDSLEHAVVFTDKRKYNRKNSQLPKANDVYLLEQIPLWRYLYNDRKI